MTLQVTGRRSLAGDRRLLQELKSPEQARVAADRGMCL